jgi:hypothetical protein
MRLDQKFAQSHAAQHGSCDLISGLYRKIGISAVAAVLEATASKSQNSVPSRKDIPTVLHGEVAA